MNSKGYDNGGAGILETEIDIDIDAMEELHSDHTSEAGDAIVYHTSEAGDAVADLSPEAGDADADHILEGGDAVTGDIDQTLGKQLSMVA